MTAGQTFCHHRALASITSTKPGGSTIGKHSYTYNDQGNITMWKREAPLANPTVAGVSPRMVKFCS